MPVQGNCPHCVAPYTLADDFYRKAAGKQARCDRCGQFFTLPAAAPPIAAPATPILSYQTPPAIALPDDGDCWQQEMKYLVIRNNGATPNRCVKCNAPAEGFWVSKKFRPPTTGMGTGYSGGAIGAIFALIGLIFLIIDLVTQKTIRVRLALCPEHRAKRQRQIWMAAILMLSSPVIAGIGISLLVSKPYQPGSNGWIGIPLLIVGIVGFVGGIIWISIAAQVLGYQTMNEQVVTLKWAGKQFLASLRQQ